MAEHDTRKTASAPDQKSGAGAFDILVAEIGAPHGVRGLVRLKVYTETPEALKAYPLRDKTGKAFELRHYQPGPKGMVAGFKNVSTREGAEALRHVKLFTSRDALPPLEDEEDYYITDLIGLEVRDTSGTKVGSVRSVQTFGAGDLLDIVGENGISGFLPCTFAFVPEVLIS